MAEESFELRVKRLFGSKLFETVPQSSFPTSSWSVADGEVERHEWNRERGAGPDREDDPCSSAFSDRGCLLRRKKSARDRKKEFEGDLLDDEEEEEEEEEERGGGGAEVGDDEEREEREIQSSVGLDPTLDNEDEEDEYDKAAFCREDAGERLYMRDVKDHGHHLNIHAVVADLLEEPSDNNHLFHRDPRADHLAAGVRLREDYSPVGTCHMTDNNEEPATDLPVITAENDANLKPILKRKVAQIDSKPKKRVRFDPGCKDEQDDVFEEAQDFPMVPQSMETNEASEGFSSMPEGFSAVPDYLRNPSKYTRYTFDSSADDDDETNKRAFEDFRNLVKRSEEMQHELPVELPKSVTFMPRKKLYEMIPMDASSESAQEDSRCESGQAFARSMGIAAGEADEGDACEMEEDDKEIPVVEKTSIISRRDRQYRSKLASDDSN